MDSIDQQKRTETLCRLIVDITSNKRERKEIGIYQQLDVTFDIYRTKINQLMLE
jgi:hypothetical protein